MYVAKNSTHHYTSWWYIQRMADFNFNDASDPDLEGLDLMVKVDRQTLPDDSRDADGNVCLELFTLDAENACFAVGSEDDDDDIAAAIGVSGMVFSVLGFVVATGFGIAILSEVRKRGNPSLSSSESSSGGKL